MMPSLLTGWEALFSFGIGAVIGSFLNVVGLRFLRDESLWPGSYCYGCQRRIRPWENIPILSWVCLHGRCQGCHAKISLQYPLVEFTTGILFLVSAFQFGWTLQTLFLLVLISNLMVICITDLREQYIFDINSLGLIPIGLLYTYLHPGFSSTTRLWTLGPLHLSLPESFLSALMAVIGAFVLFFFLNLFSRLLVGKPGFGEGDTRLLMGVGAFFGVPGILITFVLGFIVQAVIGIPLLMKHWLQHRAYKVVFLFCVGFLLAIFPYGLQLICHEFWLVLGMAVFLGFAAMICILTGIRMAKDLPGGLTYLPFGPALVFGCLIVIFFQPALKRLIEAYWGPGLF